MKTRIGAALVIGTLICILAGCGGEEYKAKTTGGEEQKKMITPGQPLMAPPGAPGSDRIGKSSQPAMGIPAGQPMKPPGQ